jgi:hypothetical protein
MALIRLLVSFSTVAIVLLVHVDAFPQTSETVEIAILQAGDRQADDWFGWSVAISGDRIIVGAVFEDTKGEDAGAAYVFEGDGDATWTESTVLRAGDVGPGDLFGYAASISHNTVIIGAPFEDTGGENAGAAYIFERDGAGTWAEVAQLYANDAEPSDIFGISASIHGDQAIVGADQEDTGGDGAGAAYIFERDGVGAWAQVARLKASDAGPGDAFGGTVSIENDWAVVGAFRKDGGQGAVYLFRRDGADEWTEVSKLLPSDAQVALEFGASVSMAGNRIIVGAPNSEQRAGAAYIFERDSSDAWFEVRKLQASDSRAEEGFGHSVAISGNAAVVGTNIDDRSQEPVGSAYWFVLEDSLDAWVQDAKINASDTVGEVDQFGWSVSINGDQAVVGAFLQKDGVPGGGAAYVYRAPQTGTQISHLGEAIPTDFSISQNYPNPFNPATTIKYTLLSSQRVSVEVHDGLGRLVAVLVDGIRPSGSQQVTWFPGKGTPSGIYFYTMRTGNGSMSKSMLLNK